MSLSLSLLTGATAAATGDIVLPVGSQRQLVADQSWQETLRGGARRIYHRPTPQERLSLFDESTSDVYRYMTVFQEGDRYRMYYALINIRYVDGKLQRQPERICYAESRDGIVWEKPVLNLFEHQNSRENNIIWMEDEATGRLGVSGFSPFRDERPDCPPEERYKAVAEAGPVGKRVLGHNGLLAMVSADGIHWKMLQPTPIMTGGPGRGNFDTQNIAFWDTVRQEYRLYRREVYNEGPLKTHRDILTATSPDFRNWSEPVRLSYGEAMPEQLYTNNVLPYFRAPHLYVGFPVRYVQRGWSPAIAALPERERREALIRAAGAEPEPKNATQAGGQRIGTALTDVLFMISRDGVNFDRPDEAFIRPGLRTRDNWFYADNFPAWGLVTTRPVIADAPEELTFYVTEGARREGVANQCRRYTLRQDGFASIDAPLRGGELISRPMRLEGNALTVNFSASAAGSIRLELQEADGTPIPGFTAEECVELLGDDLERPVTWSSGQQIGALAGRTVRLRFVLADASLYAFKAGSPEKLVETQN